MEQVENFNKILSHFNIKASCVDYYSNNRYSSYDIRLNPKTKISSIQKYAKEISLALMEESVPKITPILEKGILKLEFINPNYDFIDYFELSKNVAPPKDKTIPILLGKDSYGKNIWMDLESNPHLLVAGCSGSGKSVALHNIIANVLKFSNTSLFLIDPKRIEFFHYENVRDINVIYSYQETLDLLDKLHLIMESRYAKIKSGCNPDFIKPIILIIDEFADLSMQDISQELYLKLCTLTQKCRASKIHIVLATQRPSSKLIDGNIKGNFPARLCCKVASKVDSRIVLDSAGAEELTGKGDSLIHNYENNMTRLKIAYADPQQIIKRL